MTITLNGTTGITTPDITSDSYTGAIAVNASAPDNSLVVNSAGNVGIGTSTIGSAGVSLNNAYNIGWTQSAGESVPNIFRQASSAATVVANGYRYTATSNGFASSFSSSFAKSAISVGDGSVRFYTDTAATTAAGTDVTPTERARIDSSGHLLAATTSTDPTYDRVNGTGLMAGGNAGRIFSRGSGHSMGNSATSGTQIQWWTDNGSTRVSAGTISSSGSSTAYNTSSDYRLKEDWVAVANASTRVNALKPVNFAWISSGERVDGFLAHELADVVPEAVTGSKDAMRDEEYEITPRVMATYDEESNELTPAVEAVMGTRSVPDYQGIDQSKLVPLLTAALQEALAAIEALTARVSALEAK